MKVAYLINFDKELSEDIMKQIKEAYKEIDELIVINKQVSIKLHKQIYIQCVDIRQKLEDEYPDIFSGDKPLIVNPPGFSMAAIYLINEIEAKLKIKPFILELIKDKEPGSLFGRFKFRRILDLEYNKNVTRTKSREQEPQDNKN